MITYKGKLINSSDTSDLYTIHRSPPKSMLTKLKPDFTTATCKMYRVEQLPDFQTAWIQEKKNSLHFNINKHLLVYIMNTTSTNEVLLETNRDYPIQVVDTKIQKTIDVYVVETGGDTLNNGSRRKTSYAILRLI